MDDLVKRLRTGRTGALETWPSLCSEAADYIEHLQEMLLAARLMMAGKAKDLTQSRAETAAAVEMLNDADHQYNRRTNDMIARHAAAQAKSRAETAAAYKRAAKAVTDAPVFSDSDTDGQSAAKVIALGRAAKAIRALATPDQTAALDRLIADAVGPYVALLKRWQGLGCPNCNGDCSHANPPIYSCIMQETHAAILAAIKGAKA